MDKYEYQVCADQIKSLIKEHRFQEAMDIADTIDWRRVKSFSMLCTVSEIYKVTKHYSDAVEILLLAYERYPDRPNVVYALCELAIKLDDVQKAIEYYREYVHLKPHDTNRYVLLYKIYDAQDVPIEEKISLLEEFKRAEYTEKWAYELALLYHKDGQETKCVETCDELALWFGDGPYVRKALELKMQHSPLTREQQQKYDGVFDGPKIPSGETEETVHIYETQSMPMYQKGAASPYETTPMGGTTGSLLFGSNANREEHDAPLPAQTPPAPKSTQQTADIQITPYSNDKYSTINLQEELAKNMEEFYAKEQSVIPTPYYGVTSQLYDQSQAQFMQQLNNAGPVPQPQPVEPYAQPQQNAYGRDMYGRQQDAYGQDMYAPQQNVYGQDAYAQQPYGQGMYAQQPYGRDAYAQQQNSYGRDAYVGQPVKDVVQPEASVSEPTPAPSVIQPQPVQPAAEPVQAQTVVQPVPQPEQPVPQPVPPAPQPVQPVPQPAPVQPVIQPQPAVQPVQPQQEEQPVVDEQVPGQIDLSDFMKDWEAKKKNGEEKRKQEILNRTKEQTSDIMAQLVGVIPGIDNVTETAPQPAKPEEKAEPANTAAVTEEVLRDDKSGVVTRTTIPSPVFDREEVKRTESGARINGPAKTSITEAIPDILPDAGMPLKGDVLPSGRKLTLDEEYGGHIAQIRKEDEELVKRLTGEIPDTEEVEEEEIPTGPESVDYGETEEMEDIEQPDLPEDEDDREEKPEEEIPPIYAVNAEESFEGESGKETDYEPVEELEPEPEEPEEAEESEAIEAVPEEAAAEKEPEPVIKPLAELAAGTETEPEEKESSQEADSNAVRHGLTAPIQYPYSVDDIGEVEELETIDQPDEVDDMLKTRPIPQEEIEARMRYEAGIEEDYSAEDETSRKPNHPSWMKLEENVTSRREFDESERMIFGRFEGIESLKAQIVDVMDDMRMEASRGNVIVMGSENFGRKGLAIDIVKAIQSMDSTFSGKVAKISGEALNKKNIPMTLQKLRNGALIVENAGGLTPITLNAITESLQNDVDSILVVFEGDKETLEPLLNGCVETKTVFDARITIDDFSNSDLVAYAKGYARELEYSIDDMGTLALYNKIGDMQTIDHVVTVDEVIEIVDSAIRHVDRKNMSHFMDVLLAKRYDEDDYIVLREKDFLN